MHSIEKITSSLVLGEGPHWDVKCQKLYFVDILQKEIHCYNIKNNKHTKAVVGNGEKTISFIIPIQNRKEEFVISYGCELARIFWNGVDEKINEEDLVIVASVGEDGLCTQINDGKCSPSGVLFAGTTYQNIKEATESQIGVCGLYALVNGKIKKLHSGVKISNGLAWSSDEKKFFYIDSCTYQIKKFDYNPSTIEISNETILFDSRKENIPGILDGMTIDTSGNLWVAVFNGDQVLKIDSNSGKLLGNITFPTPKITSVTIGGENFDELFVTSGSPAVDKAFNIEPAKTEESELGGCTFRVRNIGIKGFINAEVKLEHL